VIDHACSQLLKKRPVFFSIFGRGEINTVLVSQFLLAETKERAKSVIYEKWLTFQVLDRNSHRTSVENIPEKLGVGLRFGYCYVSHLENLYSTCFVATSRFFVAKVRSAEGTARISAVENTQSLWLAETSQQFIDFTPVTGPTVSYYCVLAMKRATGHGLTHIYRGSHLARKFMDITVTGQREWTKLGVSHSLIAVLLIVFRLACRGAR
jgi:hypothetical protein